MAGGTGARRALPWAGLALLCALLAGCGSTSHLGGSGGATGDDLPTAVAPPDPGAALPPLRLHTGVRVLRAPAGPRPQLQLREWAAAMSEELDIPRAALEAYGYAAGSVATSRPHCGLSWPVLAGIGSVESSHGRYGGARLDDTAKPSIPIRGLPLNGEGGVRRIEDTDGGQLDGDPVYDRAVGPLQFIPTTWRRWAVDADADGVADPHDLDDAALAAANYLCAEAGDLRRAERFWVAVLDYNASRSYGQDVLDHADHYGRVSQRLVARR